MRQGVHLGAGVPSVLTIDLQRATVDVGVRVLDLGAGGGRHAFACARAGASVVALDTDSDECTTVAGMFAAMAEVGEIDPDIPASSMCGDALSLPFADASFDVVICSEVLEHIARDDLAMAECARVLRPGGVLALSVPRAWPERVNWALSTAYHDRPGGHLRIYRRTILLARARRAGFSSRGGHHAHGLHSPYWWLRCAIGVDDEGHPLVAAYHRLLVWDIMARPKITRAIEAALNPVAGKSLVVYLERVAS
jgi:SAM-dependent methyltransferase